MLKKRKVSCLLFVILLTWKYSLEIVASTTEMLVSINTLRRTIANASFAGLKSWSKAREVVNKAASWFDKHPKTAGLMKGFAILGVVSFGAKQLPSKLTVSGRRFCSWIYRILHGLG
jgi:hypothetical protein